MGGPLDVLQQQTNALADPNLNTRATLPQALAPQPGEQGGQGPDPRLIQHLAGQISQGENELYGTQFRTLQNVRHRFGVGIPTLPESERGFVDPRSQRAIEDWVSARKNFLMWPKEMGGGGMRQPTALTQAVAEARVNFPDVSMAQILGGIGPPQPETLGRFGVEVSPARAARISERKTMEFLQDPVTQGFVEDARKFMSEAGFQNASAKNFVNWMYDSLVFNAENPGVDEEGNPNPIRQAFESSGYKSAGDWAKAQIREDAPKLSIATALTGLY